MKSFRYLIFPLLAAAVLRGPSDSHAQSTGPELTADEAIPPAVDPMYQRGIRYLASTQQPDGSWSDGYGTQPGVVALAVAAILGHGDDPNSGPYANTIRKGLEFILSQQNKETGYIGSSMYNHGFATMVLGEAYGEVDMPGLGPALQKAVDCILNSQKNNRHGAWRYGPDSRDADTSVSGAVIVGLFSARNAGLAVPDLAFERALGYFDKMRASSGGYGYTSASSPNYNRTAIGVLAFCLARQKDKPHVAESVKFLSQNLSYRDSSYPYYFEYYMSQALFQADLELWQKWNTFNIKYLSTIQSPDGSWPGSKGTAFNTSAALLSLALNYRFLPIYER